MTKSADDRGLRRKGTAAMLCASFCFSLGGLFIKVIPWNPLAINGARNLIACCVIGLYLAGFLLHEGYTFLSEPVFRAIWKTEKQKRK